MTNASNDGSPSVATHIGIAIAAISLLAIGGGLLAWTNQDPPDRTEISQTQSTPKPVQMRVASLPMPPNVKEGFHSVAYSVENGTPVVKIRVVAEGDELIVDANSGRLLETRPSRPTAPPPMGKFAAPFAPIM